MDTPTQITLGVLFLMVAMLYSSVGQAGASSYLAIMALYGIAPEIMRPTALTLNLLVATIALLKFYRAGSFARSTFWPFALGSVPSAFLGGSLMLPDWVYRPLVGLVLFFAAYRVVRRPKNQDRAPLRPFRPWLAIFFGIGIGFLSGLTGVGGGIFLTPLLLLLGWADMREAAAVSAAFILVNSLAGLFGQLSSFASLPNALPLWAAAAAVGGWIGAEYGSRRLGSQVTQRLLAIVLIIAGLRIMLTRTS